MRKAALASAAFLFAAALSGCAGQQAFGGSRAAVEAWALQRGFVPQTLRAGTFDLLALSRTGTGAGLTIYIEGDGAAWSSPYHPPSDPTPPQPLALALAAADTRADVVYLGRPCQYLESAALAACPTDYWLQRRFAPEVVAAYMAAIDRLEAVHRAHRVTLVGYSGGGVIAALLAQRRTDVEVLVTVAAPLALGEWVRGHGVSELAGSLDPAAAGTTVRATWAVHFVGERDKVVPPAVVERFVELKGGRLVRLADHDHDCCWARDWPGLLEDLR
ncbi:MAG: alpha/beta hydrolase [Gammaproteobacteria bacterium]|nr:alpha/beta hydrolase [Gammaproteobacteria bacterium]